MDYPIKEKPFRLPASFFILLVLSLSGCPGTGRNIPVEAGAGVAVLAAGVSAPFEPAVFYPSGGRAVHLYSALYETLFYYTSGTEGPQPLLAESFEISDDRLTYRIKIREGIYFHDKSALDAEAAAVSLKAFGRRAGAAEEDGALSLTWKNIKEVYAEGEYVLHIKLYSPDPLLIHALCDISAAIIREKKGGEEHFPAGTGPYSVTGIRRDNSTVTADRFLQYHRKENRGPGRIVFRFIEDPDAVFLALAAGSIDFADVSDPGLSRKINGKNYKTVSGSGGKVYYAFFKNGSSFSDNYNEREKTVNRLRNGGLAEEMFRGKFLIHEKNTPWPFRFLSANPVDTTEGAEDIKEASEENVFQLSDVPETNDTGRNSNVEFSGWVSVFASPLFLSDFLFAGNGAENGGESKYLEEYPEHLYSAWQTIDNTQKAEKLNSASAYLSSHLPWYAIAFSMDVYAVSGSVTGITFLPGGRLDYSMVRIR